MCVCVCVYAHTRAHMCLVVQVFSTWTLVCQAPLSIGLSRQEYCSGLPFPPPKDLPDLGMESTSPALAGRFTTEPPGKQNNVHE